MACCRKDNHRKADRTPEEAGMPLLRRPLPASVHTGRFILRSWDGSGSKMSGAGICMPTPKATGDLPFADEDGPV